MKEKSIVNNAYYSDYLNRARARAADVAPRLKSSLQKFYSSHHDLVDRFEYSYLK
jgi:hypothetical protein